MLSPLGGGIKNLKAVELNQIIPNCYQNKNNCKIETTYSDITNHSNFTIGGDVGITINARIDTLTNYGNMTATGGNQAFQFDTNGYIGHFINHGNISTDNKMSFWVTNGVGISKLTNYGTMGAIEYKDNLTLTINNFGVIKRYNNANIHYSNALIQNYMLIIDENSATFNGNNNYSLSHLVVSGSGIRFKDGNSRIILDFGNNFKEGEAYKLNKLIVDTGGANALNVEFDRLVPRNDLYHITQQGDYFIVRLQPQHSAISNIYKANVRTMNNFWTLSNSMIYPRKSYKSQNLRSSSLRDLPTANRGNPHYENIVNSTLDSAIPLKSYESFAYRNESVNRRIQRQNKRNYNRKSQNQAQNLKETQRNSQNLNADSANQNNQNNSSLRAASQNLRGNPKDLQALRSNHPQTNKEQNYYFILTPFFNYNLFTQSGNYNLRGFDYGFLTAFSARVAESNSLGAHFIFSYGSLGDKQDKDLSIKSLNLNVGLNYKLDLIYDMYFKVRGDFFYFLNQAKTLTMLEAIKPNNLGFGASVSYGKDFDFKQGGVLGIEAGLDYKALKTNEVSLNSQTYKQSLLNLIYADLGVNYAKYFGGFGINLGTGFKANLAPKLAESILILNSQNLRFVLDNDKYLGYANAVISYALNAKSFDMEFSLAYYGNFGDRIISNAGGFEWRTRW